MTRPTTVLAALLAIVLAACTGGASASPPASASGGPAGSPAPVKLRVGLGFIPNVQFAQFYLADGEGYYREAGLEVSLENRIDPELVTLVGQGAFDVGLADGTSVIPAVSRDIPIRYGATIYADFPNIVFAKADSGIARAADLRGKRIGIPGRYGSGWIMLQALLGTAGLTTEDVTIVEYPDFGQGAAVTQGAVDAATGFVNNEPVQLRLAGFEPVILRVDEEVPLPGNGLIVGTATLSSKRDALRAFVAATLRAMEEIAADPDRGLEAAIARVPELGAKRETQRAILDATIDTWQDANTERDGLGAIVPTEWDASVAFMSKLPGDLVARPLAADELVTLDLLPR